MHPIVRMSIIFFGAFFGFMIGTALTFNTFIIIFKYESIFSKIFYKSFWVISAFYIVLFSSIYINKNVYNKLYYWFFFILSWYFYNLFGFLAYYLINLIITLPSIINLLIYVCLGTGITADGIYRDNNPQYDYITLKCKKLRGGQITIAHLSDMHLGCCYGAERVQQIVDMILNCKKSVDLVVITGDILDGNVEFDKSVLEPFNQIKYPIYYISGNHEIYTNTEQVFSIIDNETNIIHLKDSFITYQNRINIAGADYLFNRTVAKKNIKIIMNQIKNDESIKNYPNVFLNHVPIFKASDLQENNIFLFLCGHMHGGQLFPGNLIRYLLPSDKVFEGLYNYKDLNYVYCSCGIGTSGPMARGFITPKIGIITLEPNN